MSTLHGSQWSNGSLGRRREGGGRRGAVRAEPGTVADDGDGQVADRPAGLAGQGGGVAAEAEAVGAGPARVAGGEVPAQVAEAAGAQQRVADGVGDHVG